MGLLSKAITISVLYAGLVLSTVYGPVWLVYTSFVVVPILAFVIGFVQIGDFGPSLLTLWKEREISEAGD